MSEMTEMDGTGLPERENWPLGPSRPLSPQSGSVGSESGGSALPSPKSWKSFRRAASPRIDEEGDGEAEVREDAVMREAGDIGQEPAAYYVEDEDAENDEEDGEGKDVSDMEEEDDDDGRELYEDLDESKERQKILPEEPKKKLHEDVSPERDLVQEQPLASSPAQPASVSPVRRDQGRSPQLPNQADQRDVSPVRVEDPLGGPNEEIHQTNGVDDEVGPLPPQSDHSQIYEADSEDDSSEERDVATPIPFSHDGTASPLPSPAPTYTSQPNGRSTPTTNGHTRQSSMMKSTPPQRHSSRRSPSITTQIPHKERVRYSWQSLADDEPNRPRIHIIKLVSNTATASAGFPQGEAFGFSISPAGRRIAAYNSARLYILQTAALPVGISQDYALKRRPLAVEIVDEGNMLAILADSHTVNLYDLGHQKLKRIRTVKLDFPTNTIALAPTGGLLAAAYEGGVEIFSLSPDALPTDRRAVRSQRMDRLTFSEDGSSLLGTTTRINVSSTMVVSVPVFPASPTNVPTHEELKEAWCSELLHPENIRNSSHATFMREGRSMCNERLFAWNGLADTFGILNIGDMQYGNIDFPVVISPPLSTCGGLGAAIHSCPAIDEHGDTVAMVVNDRTIRLYIVPYKADDDETTIEAHSIDHELDEGYGCPFSDVRWVYSSASLPAPLNNQTQVQGRLIVTSPGGVVEPNLGNTDELQVEDIEGGRIILFDFDPQFAGQPGQTFSLTLGKSPPQLLDEPKVDVHEEVALVRRRTVNQSQRGGLSQRPVTLGRAATTFAGQRDRGRQSPSPSFGGSTLPTGVGMGISTGGRRSMQLSIHSLQSDATRSLPDLVETNEAFDTMEEPYAQNAPRSQASLQRAASNAQRHRFQTLEERNQERSSVDSSAASNFLPLPEYTEEPNAPLPSRFRTMAGLDGPSVPTMMKKPAVITSAEGDRISPTSSTPSTAPPNIGESFSAEQAFAAAQAASAEMILQSQSQPTQRAETSRVSPTSPTNHAATPSSTTTFGGRNLPSAGIARSDTFSSLNSMPRGLQRAYGNATSGPPPSLIGDWENVSPIVGTNTTARGYFTPSQSGTLMNGTFVSVPSTETVPEEGAWDANSPVGTANTPSPFGARRAQTPNSYRYSTSLLNPPGHTSPQRAPSTASSFATSTSSSPSSRGGRRLPPHIQALHKAAAANASASLFPPNQPSDHVPLRQPPSTAGSVAHPITAWHPPAPSTAPALAPSGSVRGHSRKSSLAGKSAFASTEKAKKLGFFQRGGGGGRKKKNQLFGPEFADSGPYGGVGSAYGRRRGGGGRGEEVGSVMETRSMFTTLTRGEGKCAIM